MKMIAGAAQFDAVPNGIEHNLSAMERIARSAPGLRLLVFPELCVTGYSCFNELHALAEPVGGSSMKRVSALCRETGSCIAYGFAERAEEGIYNSAAFIDEKGNLCGVFRKVHLFDEEREYFIPGKSFRVISTPLGRAGIMVCWDLSYPESARSLMLQGAELLISCSAWEYPYAENYTLVSRARAYENCLPHVAANRIGIERDCRFIGESAIYEAGGKPLARLSDEKEGIASAIIETNPASREEEYPFKLCRRPDAYAGLQA